VSGPQHHLDEDVLLAYSAGTLPEALNLLIATHIALCPGCYGANAALDAIGASVMLQYASEPVANDLLDRTLLRLDEPAPAIVPSRAPRSDLPDLPEPLRSVVADRPWVRVAPGIRVIELPVRFGTEPARLTQLTGPMAIPHHGHHGVEAQLVLAGGFSDKDVAFRRGDIQWADSALEHGIDIHPGEPCVTLLVKDARLIQRTLRGRLFAWITGT
jgi:putative transcriptional regulator